MLPVDCVDCAKAVGPLINTASTIASSTPTTRLRFIEPSKFDKVEFVFATQPHAPEARELAETSAIPVS